MEKNAAAGRTPSSLPLSTPPPSSLSLSSPELAPLSPVHTNSLNDAKSLNVKSEPTSFNLPPSYMEDGRANNTIPRGLTTENSFGDQRNERYISGGNRLFFLYFFLFFPFCFIFVGKERLIIELSMETAVTSGTLDAIRERMKSMQLAAAAGNPDSESRPNIYMNDNVNQGFSDQVHHAPEQASSENPVRSGVLPMDEKALSGLQARMERLKSGTLEPL